MTATSPGLACSQCGVPLDPSRWNNETTMRCPSCFVSLRVWLFPALLARPPAAQPASAVAEGESTCFHHPRKRAVSACQKCGRFLCSLCDLELHGEHWCPGCLESGQRKQEMRTLENSRTHYDTLALALATAPILFWPFTLFTAPGAVYVALRYWKRPPSVIPRTRVRYILAILIGAAQTIAWAWLFVFLLYPKR